MEGSRHALAERVRRALPTDRPQREVAMFGGLSFMLDERMLVAVRGEADLLVRIDPDQHAELLGRPGAEPAMMGSARPMGPGWIVVRGEALDDDGALADWIRVALHHHAGQDA